MAMHIIEELEREYTAELLAQRPVPAFSPGDTVRVNVRVREGGKERVQAYEGVVIARAGGGLNESFTVRKISYGEGVERVFPLHSPMLESIEVKRHGRVRRAKLYYLRGRRGKSARIAEKKDYRAATKRKAAARRDDTAPLFARPPGEADDLSKISGVGDVLVQRLDALGVTRFDQIANFSDDDIARIDDVLNFKGRIERDDWVGQAARLMAESTVDEAVRAAQQEEADNAESKDAGENAGSDKDA